MAKLCPAGKAAAKKSLMYTQVHTQISGQANTVKAQLEEVRKLQVEYVRQLLKVKETLMERIHEWSKKMAR